MESYSIPVAAGIFVELMKGESANVRMIGVGGTNNVVLVGVGGTNRVV